MNIENGISHQCPITLESMATNAMVLYPCMHHISEPGLKMLLESKKINYKFSTLASDLYKNNAKYTCPICRNVFEGARADREYRQILQAAIKANLIKESCYDLTQDNESSLPSSKDEIEKVDDSQEFLITEPSVDNLSNSCGLFSYENSTLQTEKELDALENGNYLTCLKWGIVSRFSRAMQCLLCTPVKIMETGVYCLGGTCYLFQSSYSCSFPPKTQAEEERQKNMKVSAQTMGNACLDQALVSMEEGLINVICFPVNVGCPEFNLGSRNLNDSIVQTKARIKKKKDEARELLYPSL